MTYNVCAQSLSTDPLNHGDCTSWELQGSGSDDPGSMQTCNQLQVLADSLSKEGESTSSGSLVARPAKCPGDITVEDIEWFTVGHQDKRRRIQAEIANERISTLQSSQCRCLFVRDARWPGHRRLPLEPEGRQRCTVSSWCATPACGGRAKTDSVE